MVGGALASQFAGPDLAAFNHQELDITDFAAVERSFQKTKPQIVLNAAAFTRVDDCERLRETAFLVNAQAPAHLAELSKKYNSFLVHFSTDYIFDGNSDRPYLEDDAPNPRGAYAASKLVGDWFALEAPRSWILRVESLFGKPAAGGKRLGSLGAILEGIRTGAEVPVFTDRTVSPSYTADVARTTRELLERGTAPGLYHCVNSGAATWAEVATEAARLLGLPLRMKPVTLESAGLKARRPRYCALSNAKLASSGIQMPTWQDALTRHLRQ